MTRLLSRREKPDFIKGAFPSITGENNPFVSYSEGVIFDANGVSPIEGQRLALAPQDDQALKGIYTQNIDGQDYVFWGWRERVYVTPYDGNLSAPAPDSVWSSFVLGGLRQMQFVGWGTWTILCTNGGHPLRVRKGSGTNFNELSGAAAVAGRPLAIARRSPYLLAFSEGNSYNWCDADDVETWAPTADNSAGGNVFRDVDSETVAAREWKGEVIALTQDNLIQVSYIGPPDYFGHFPLLKGIGAVGPHAVAIVGDIIYGCSDKGVWRSDGTTYQYIDTPAVRNFFFKHLNRDRQSLIVVAYDKFHQRIYVFFPFEDSNVNNFCLMYSLLYENWSPLPFGRSCADYGGMITAQLYGGTSGGIWEQRKLPSPPTPLNTVPAPMDLSGSTISVTFT